MSDLCVVHLVWKPLGPAFLRRFLEAYRRVDAGRPHRLLVVLNGFAGDDAGPWRALLEAVPHEELVLGSPVQDIPAYVEAARHAEAETLCFCNSYSEPLVDGWLAMLHARLVQPGVGLVGASGSWESHRSNLEHLVSPSGVLARVADRLAPGRVAVARADARQAISGPRRSAWERLRHLRRELARARERFEPFPSPHVRTNGFMVRRALFTGLHVAPVRDKQDALEFESGRASLTRQVEARGLDVLVVGRDGRGYAPPDWWHAGAYRSGDQYNLLISDNRTAEWAAMTPQQRARVSERTWGRDPAHAAAIVARRARPANGAPHGGPSA